MVELSPALGKILLQLEHVERDQGSVLRGTESEGGEVERNILLLQDLVRHFAVVKIDQSYTGKPKEEKR